MDAVVGGPEELAEFRPGALAPKVLYETDRFTVVLAALEPDQEIPLHAPGVDVAVAVLRGTGELWVGDAPRAVAAGDVAVVPAGVTRAVRPTGGRLILLHVVSPPPGPADHEAERRPWPEPARGPDVEGALREEHGQLLPHLDHLRALAEEVRELDECNLRARLEGVLGFLTGTLLPHAAAEEAALYPAVDRVLRSTGGATATMSVDHRDIGERIHELADLARSPLSAEVRARIERALVALEAVVRLHFRKEEEVYLPLASRLSAGEREELLQGLAAGGGGHHHDEREGGGRWVSRGKRPADRS